MENKNKTKKVSDLVKNTIQLEMDSLEVVKKLGIKIDGKIETLSIYKRSYEEGAVIEITSKMEDRLSMIDYTKTKEI